MTFDYANSQRTADRLIRRFGKQQVVTRQSQSGDNWNPVLTPEPQNVVAAVIPYKQSQVDGTVIKQTDKQVYVSPLNLTFAPDVGHTITINGVEHEIMNSDPLNPADTDVYYLLQARA